MSAEQTFGWAWALLDGLAAAGLRRVVVSPGSRSTPLALAALRHPALAVSIVVDERSAAFFALGAAKAEGLPVGLIATSGSAIANWFPAVAEADMARVPLILLSSDRPPEMQDCGANQTMDQPGLFGSHVRKSVALPPAEAETGWLAAVAGRAVEASLSPLPGPVHVNLPLREPLVPAAGAALPDGGRRPPKRLGSLLQPDDGAVADLARLLSAGPGAILCGPGDLGQPGREAVVGLARRLGVPIFADLLSGLRLGAAEADPILAHPEAVVRAAPKPAWLLRFGAAPVTKAVGAWPERCRGIPQVVVADHPRLSDPAGTATHVIRADAALLCRRLAAAATPAASGWLDCHLALDAAAAAAAEQIGTGDQPFEGALLRRLVRALPAGTPLFLGNSLVIRAAEWFAGRIAAQLPVFGNRGVSGIDGNLSTAFGIAAARGRTVAVVGDLTFLHDVGGLALGRDLPLTLLLLDNGGGGIFDHLAQAVLPEFEQGWLTPRPLDQLAAARAFGLACQPADGIAATLAAVAASFDRAGTTVIRVPIDRRFSLARCRDFFSACIVTEHP